MFYKIVSLLINHYYIIVEDLFVPWRERLPTSVLWPGEVHELYGPWDHKGLDTTEWLSHSLNHISLCDTLISLFHHSLNTSSGFLSSLI